MSGTVVGPIEYVDAQKLSGTPNVIAVPTSEPADSVLAAGQLTIWLDEGTHDLIFKVKHADGVTVKSGKINLT